MLNEPNFSSILRVNFGITFMEYLSSEIPTHTGGELLLAGVRCERLTRSKPCRAARKTKSSPHICGHWIDAQELELTFRPHWWDRDPADSSVDTDLSRAPGATRDGISNRATAARTSSPANHGNHVPYRSNTVWSWRSGTSTSSDVNPALPVVTSPRMRPRSSVTVRNPSLAACAIAYPPSTPRMMAMCPCQVRSMLKSQAGSSSSSIPARP